MMWRRSEQTGLGVKGAGSLLLWTFSSSLAWRQVKHGLWTQAASLWLCIFGKPL